MRARGGMRRAQRHSARFEGKQKAPWRELCQPSTRAFCFATTSRDSRRHPSQLHYRAGVRATTLPLPRHFPWSQKEVYLGGMSAT